MSGMELTPELMTQIRHAVAEEDAILFTGAGFSASVLSRAGKPMPAGSALAEEIWKIAFPGEAYDKRASLPDVFQAAYDVSPSKLKELLDDLYCVGSAPLAHRFIDWFDLPWLRVYTLNIDDLDEVVSQETRDELNIISALTSGVADANSAGKAVVHINGRISEFPNIIFTADDFASRTALSDGWYQQLSSDIYATHVIFIGTQLNESPLWHYVRMRGYGGANIEVRPKSWLVTKSLDVAREKTLSNYNIDLIAMREGEFFEKVFQGKVDDCRDNSARSRISLTQSSGAGIESMDQILSRSTPGDPNFLLGYEPTVGDIARGYAVTFEFDEELLRRASRIPGKALILTGTAGSGKSTALLRLALRLHSQGKKVLYVDPVAKPSIRALREAAHAQNADYVFIDEIARFGNSTNSLINGILNSCPTCTVVGATRWSDRLNSLRRSRRVGFVSVSNLTEDDAEKLIAALTSAGVIGNLSRLGHTQQLSELTRLSHTSGDKRQLLAMLIEATSGKRFQDKVASEYREQADIAKAIYGVLCMVQAVDQSLLLNVLDISSAIDDADNTEKTTAINELTARNLIMNRGIGWSARHRVIADEVFNVIRNEGHFRRYATKVLVLAAIKCSSGQRYRSLLTQFLNHNFIANNMKDLAEGRQIYAALESYARKQQFEFHYWLQRGNFETDYGDLRDAEEYLMRAIGINGSDVKIRTAWCHLLLKRASASPGLPRSPIDARNALRELDQILDGRPSESPNTYVVYFREGLKWMRAGRLTTDEQRNLLDRLKGRIGVAREDYPYNPVVMGTAADVRREHRRVSNAHPQKSQKS